MSEPLQPPLQIGRRFHGFLVQSLLGRGGMGYDPRERWREVLGAM